MNWIIASLPLMIFSILTWIALGLIVVRAMFRFRDGLTVSTLALPSGLVAYLFFVNALSYFIFVPFAVWIVNLGVWIAVALIMRRPLPPLEWDMERETRMRLAAAGLVLFTFVFLLNAREIWIDTYAHSTMGQLLASGQFPLRFQCNPAELANYQYGGNLLAASVQDTATISSWDAQDVLIAYQVLCLCALVILIIWHRTHSIRAGLLAIFLMFTVGPVVWLLLPILNPGISYLAAGATPTATLLENMDTFTQSPWIFSFVPPGSLTPTLGHVQRTFSWTFGPFTILFFLALLDTKFDSRWMKTIVLGYVLGTVSLLQPASLILLAPGFAGLTLLSYLRPNRFSVDINPMAVIALSLLVAVMQGGIITDGIASALSGSPSSTTSFSLKSPALPSCKDGYTDFSCTVLSLANLGLIPFLLPTFLITTLQGRKDNAQLVLALGAVAGYLFPIFIYYGYNPWELNRVFSFISWMLVVFLTPWFYRHLVAGGVRRWATVVFLIISTYTGITALWLIVDGRSIKDSITIDFSPLIPPNDQAMMRYARLVPLDALVFDSIPCSQVTGSRPAYVLGRYTRTAIDRSNWLVPPEGYTELVQFPRAEDMAAAGYTHLYVDQDWYYSLDEKGRRALSEGHYEVLASVGTETDFRTLLRVCSNAEQCGPNLDMFPDEKSRLPVNDDPGL